jgi:riboflavin transporter FmnP
MGLSEQAILGMVSGGLTDLGQRFGLSLSPVYSLGNLIARATIPFNILKGVALSVVTTALYKRLSPLLKDIK